MDAVFEVRHCVATTQARASRTSSAATALAAGIRPAWIVATVAFLALVGAAGLSIVSTAPWMLVVTWGVMIGLGTGSMALVFAATPSRAPVAN